MEKRKARAVDNFLVAAGSASLPHTHTHSGGGLGRCYPAGRGLAGPGLPAWTRTCRLYVGDAQPGLVGCEQLVETKRINSSTPSTWTKQRARPGRKNDSPGAFVICSCHGANRAEKAKAKPRAASPPQTPTRLFLVDCQSVLLSSSDTPQPPAEDPRAPWSHVTFPLRL